MVTIRIDEELEALIPPLDEEEFEGLERSILKEGVREPIIVWAGHGIIVDGHNRYRIATKHDVGFGVTEKEFPDREAVIDWMVDVQCKQRRNLSKGQKAALYIDAAELKYREEARLKQAESGKEHGGDRKSMTYKATKSASDQLVGSRFVSQEDSRATEDDTGHLDGDPDGREKSPYEADVPIEVVHVPAKSQTPSSDARNKARENETAYKVAKDADLGVGTVKRVMAVKHGDDDLYGKVKSGEMTANKAYTTLQERKRKVEEQEALERSEASAKLYQMPYDDSAVACDLLFTEAPPDTSWLTSAMWGVSSSGFAYVVIDDDPKVLRDYLNAETPPNVELFQVLVWRFTYLMGNKDTKGYKPNKKFILFYRGVDAPNIRYITASDRESVIDIDADGGNLGDAEYKLLMPSELAEKIIRQSTNEGGVVFDPFARRGTILLAAKKLGRNSIGYEGDKDLCEIAMSRGIDAA